MASPHRAPYYQDMVFSRPPGMLMSVDASYEPESAPKHLQTVHLDERTASVSQKDYHDIWNNQYRHPERGLLIFPASWSIEQRLDWVIADRRKTALLKKQGISTTASTQQGQAESASYWEKAMRNSILPKPSHPLVNEVNIDYWIDKLKEHQEKLASAKAVERLNDIRAIALLPIIILVAIFGIPFIAVGLLLALAAYYIKDLLYSRNKQKELIHIIQQAAQNIVSLYEELK